MVLVKTPEEMKKNDNLFLIKEILRDNYITLTPHSFEAKETFEGPPDNCVLTTLTLRENNKKRKIKLQGSGVGLVDSTFQGLKAHYQKKYSSFGSINLTAFSVEANNLSEGLSPEGSTAPVEVVLEFKNAYGKRTPFREKSYSLSSSVVIALISVCEYYINAEQSFQRLKVLIEDARNRSRGDLEQDYVNKIVNISGVSSYEDIF